MEATRRAEPIHQKTTHVQEVSRMASHAVSRAQRVRYTSHDDGHLRPHILRASRTTTTSFV